MEDIFNALDRYKDMDLSFDNSRECKLLQVGWRIPPPSHMCSSQQSSGLSCSLALSEGISAPQDLAGAMESGNTDTFTGAVAEFDAMTRLVRPSPPQLSKRWISCSASQVLFCCGSTSPSADPCLPPPA